MSTAPKIALINAVTAAIPPAQAALSQDFPEAVIWNILDDRLLVDADNRGGLDDMLRERMSRLIAHAITEQADGVLLTCSLYGPVAQATTWDLPVLAPDEAAFAELVEASYGSILVVASFEGARDDSVQRLAEALEVSGRKSRVTGIAVPKAMAASKSQDTPALTAALTEACLANTADIDAVFLAQYSLAPAADELQRTLGIPVVSGPKSSAVALRRLLADRK
ncbi:hypothetical protein [Arthrobacter ruber]|uniref:hypothetical protein n=1 Tax=Arthrobacter ruber TaxID=1258893 RepID=UPI000CF40E1A|nr:hypothetical protein [Arthrobacter ruber]